ncbi:MULTISPECIES: WXG100 family type VII secretion target [unclassified Rhodococcus (in: high G+C Gram-positive bacteria)]|uniref:WXG100 family type VII secretion target n=1 Tax=Rhodococcus sp. SJ-3 TaxID=3454628 RepID=UPI002D94774F|nr:WXG100 family type VII secretion target [Rhodococcus sp. (in: high G+C Gram-positive bacteria)]
MPDGEIYQNFGGIDDLHAGLSTLQKNMNDTLDSIARQVAPLIETWGGDAQETYRGTQERWNQAQLGLNQVLFEINTAVAGGNDRMRDTEVLNKGRFPG